MPLFDHETLKVYQVAREFLVFVTCLMAHKMTREIRAQVPVGCAAHPVRREP
jgi:hypothetical protein